MNILLRSLLAVVLSFAVPLGTMSACSKSTEHVHRYHCPMHPTYVSDKPGDCPICGMRLVPIEEKKNASAEVWTCPMHPEVISDKPGRCPKCNMPLEPKASAADAGGDRAVAPKILYYRSPMDPKVTSPTPAKDAMGMDFVPVYAEETTQAPASVPGLAPIDIDAEGLRLAGVRTAVAESGKISRTIRAVGVVRPDERRVRHVHTKIAGWIEKLFVNFTGEPVAAGRPILTIYSQELLAAQHEYLQAKKAASTMQGSEFGAVRDGADDLLKASRRRLELLDVPRSLIAALDRGSDPSRTVTVASPVGGIVMSKNAFEGQQVEPGMELFTVTDLSQVWLEADIFESEASMIHIGQEGHVSFPSDPGAAMTGRIKYVYPYLNPETRTLRVRFSFANPGLKLKLDSYANVELPVETDEGTVIQDSAILDTGLRQIVFVNTTGGHFEPRLVKVGIRSEGRAQILSGVAPGERVAIKANFLLDSESRLRAALSPAQSPEAPSTASPDGAALAPSSAATASTASHTAPHGKHP